MKTLVASLIFLSSLLLIGQSISQPLTDQASVLQKILDLPALQEYYPLNAAKETKQICIIQHLISFPAEINVRKFDMPISFLNHSDIYKNEIDAYFVFRDFEINEDISKASISFFYDREFYSNQFKMLSIIIELQKSNSTWKVSNFNLNGDQK